MVAEVFLSHNSKDKAWVRDLFTELQRQGVADVFLDEVSIHPGKRFVQKLEQGLEENTRLFILVWSANAAQSHWVPAERELALIQNLEDGGLPYLLPISLDKTPLPGFIRIFSGLKAQTVELPDGRPLPDLVGQIIRSLEHARKESGR